jgi:hypothetical protein
LPLDFASVEKSLNKEQENDAATRPRECRSQELSWLQPVIDSLSPVSATCGSTDPRAALTGFVSMRTSIAPGHWNPACGTGSTLVLGLFHARGVWLFVDAKFPDVVAESTEEVEDLSIARVGHALDERTFAHGAASRQGWRSGSVGHVVEV